MFLLPSFSFLRTDPISGGSGSPDRHRPLTGPATQHAVSLLPAYDAICCVSHPDRDLLPGGQYCRFAYSLTVVHFRKIVNSQKIGSPDNHHPVIYRRSCMPAYYQPENDDGRGKSSG